MFFVFVYVLSFLVKLYEKSEYRIKKRARIKSFSGAAKVERFYDFYVKKNFFFFLQSKTV